MRFSSIFILTTLGVLSGCANEGALGQSTVGQGCAAGDTACSPLNFDAPLAVGASLPIAIDLSLKGGGAPPLTLVSGNDDVFTADGLTLTGVGPGVASVLITSEEDVVLDFTAIWVQQAGGLALQRRAADGTLLGDMPSSLALAAGDSAVVSVSATSTSHQPLLGAPPAEWSGGDEAATVVDEGVPGRARILAKAPGKVTVKVTALGLERSFDVEVVQ